MYDRAAAPQNQMPVKPSVPSHWEMVSHSNWNLLACAPHCSRSAHPLFYLCYAFFRNDICDLCLGYVLPKGIRAKNKSWGLHDSTISSIKRRAKNRSMSPGSFRIPSGGHHLLHFARPRGLFNIQARLGNSHTSSYAWNRPFQCGIFCLLCVRYGRRSRAFMMTSLLRLLWPTFTVSQYARGGKGPQKII